MLIVGFAICAAAARLGAQASAYVPLDDIAYTYVDALMARGYFRELATLERPYTERALHEAIDSARARTPSDVVTSYLDAMYASIEKYAVRPGDSDSAAAQTFRARGSANLYATAQTSGRRELMLADSLKDIRPGASIRLVMAGGPVVGFTRALIDTRLNVDPEFAGRKDRRINGRTEDGYVGGQWKYAELMLGRVGRNWGPPTQYGLMLGNYAYTYDHLYARIGSDRIHWSTVIARLDDSVPATGPAIERYFSIHRLAVKWKNLEVAGSESYVYAGVGRGFEPSLVNPFNVYALSWRNENQEGNLGLGGEIALHTENAGIFSGQVFLDDLQIDRSCNPACKQPSSYGLTASAEGLPLGGDQRWFVSYTRLSNLAYNNKNPAEKYESFGVGLGRGFSDYDEFRGGVDLALIPRAPLRLYMARRRQGEGGYNVPFPVPADYGTTPAIFSGVTMVVTRLGVAGVSRWRDVELSGDVGLNHNTNDAHVRGASTTSLEGRLKFVIEPRWSVSF
ncbi:MAG TPA: hypothetical protein VJ840_15220 [Gemmatimonadaceae bacterium]|nr:hypothetical protein [Gemmatimonadaceae bacterium]